MKDPLRVKYLPGKTECKWHKKHSEEGHLYTVDEMFPKKFCPILFHTLYPYFLGAIFGAKYTYNAEGDCHVCCPAEKSVDVLVKVRPNDGSYGDDVADDWQNVFHAEVVKVNGPCDYEYQVGDILIFPICNREKFACSAGINNIFPFLNIKKPKCINLKRLRCPDWQENVYYSIDEEDLKKD